MAEKREVKQWITVNGVHVPIFEGESKADAVNRAVAKKNEETKAEQIAKNKKNADKLNGKSSDTEEEEFDVEYWITYNGRTAKQYARVTGGKDDMYGVGEYIKKYVKDNDLGELSHLGISRKGSGSAREEWYVSHPMYTSQFKVKDSRPLDQIAQDYIKKYKLAKGESKIPLAVIKKDIAKLDLSEKEYTRLLGMIVLGV